MRGPGRDTPKLHYPIRAATERGRGGGKRRVQEGAVGHAVAAARCCTLRRCRNKNRIRRNASWPWRRDGRHRRRRNARSRRDVSRGTPKLHCPIQAAMEGGRGGGRGRARGERRTGEGRSTAPRRTAQRITASDRCVRVGRRARDCFFHNADMEAARAQPNDGRRHWLGARTPTEKDIEYQEAGGRGKEGREAA